jgi:acyl-coenzyme A synthetase/AMP-(fatty) acid ligase
MTAPGGDRVPSPRGEPAAPRARRHARRLADLLAAPHDDQLPVALATDGGDVRRWGDLRAHAAALAARLRAGRPGRWLLACDSSYAFAVGLLALWDAGQVAVLPQSLQPGVLGDVAPGCEGLVSDGDLLPGLLPRLDPLAERARPSAGRPFDRARLCVELLTSGSSGGRRAVGKTLAPLEREVEALEATFGGRVGGAAVLGTVSHQHIYGLLFRVLWPLAAGRPFAAERTLHWPALLDAMARHRRACLVGSPTHLAGLGALPPEPSAGPRSCAAVFSSGGPLPAATVAVVAARLGAPPVEVFGSTETGGLGWRVQAGGDGPVEPWTPLPGVSVTAAAGGGERLLARSPWIQAPGARGRMILDDRGHALPDGRFTITGRADRVVKIAERRLSLDEMQAELARQPAVARAALLVLDDPGQAGRSTLGAAVVLEPEAAAELAAVGPHAMRTRLRAGLAARFDPVVLPRLFCFVDELPRDAQGKVTTATLAPLFTAGGERG